MIPDQVPADDRGLLLGDGLFETLLADRGVLEDFDRHIRRMAAGCVVLGIEPPDEAAALAAAQAAIGQAGFSEARAAVRLTLTAGAGRGLDRPLLTASRLIAQAGPAPVWQGPVSLATVGVRRNQGSPASRLKALSYLDNILARREARAAGAEEALMLNGRGEIACAAAANVFWTAGGKLYTPALDCGVLDGIVRGRVIERARALGVEVIEIAAPPDALALSEGAFLTNSLIGLRPVASLDGRALPQSPLVEALSSPDRGSAAPGGA
jgi:branched-chain amino acid aminotransferase/4-amino-4-deoxychorismate lyase